MNNRDNQTSNSSSKPTATWQPKRSTTKCATSTQTSATSGPPTPKLSKEENQQVEKAPDISVSDRVTDTLKAHKVCSAAATSMSVSQDSSLSSSPSSFLEMTMIRTSQYKRSRAKNELSQFIVNPDNVDIEAEEPKQVTEDDSFNALNEIIKTAALSTNPHSSPTREAVVVQEDGSMILANVSKDISMDSDSSGKEDLERSLKLSDQELQNDLDYSSSEEPFVPPTPYIPQGESSLPARQRTYSLYPSACTYTRALSDSSSNVESTICLSSPELNTPQSNFIPKSILKSSGSSKNASSTNNESHRRVTLLFPEEEEIERSRNDLAYNSDDSGEEANVHVKIDEEDDPEQSQFNEKLSTSDADKMETEQSEHFEKEAEEKDFELFENDSDDSSCVSLTYSKFAGHMDSMKVMIDDNVEEVPEKQQTFLLQSPQVFRCSTCPRYFSDKSDAALVKRSFSTIEELKQHMNEWHLIEQQNSSSFLNSSKADSSVSDSLSDCFSDKEKSKLPSMNQAVDKVDQYAANNQANSSIKQSETVSPKKKDGQDSNQEHTKLLRARHEQKKQADLNSAVVKTSSKLSKSVPDSDDDICIIDEKKACRPSRPQKRTAFPVFDVILPSTQESVDLTLFTQRMTSTGQRLLISPLGYEFRQSKKSMFIWVCGRSQEDDTCPVRIAIQSELQNGKARGIFLSYRQHDHEQPVLEDDPALLFTACKKEEEKDETNTSNKRKPVTQSPESSKKPCLPQNLSWMDENEDEYEEDMDANWNYI